VPYHFLFGKREHDYPPVRQRESVDPESISDQTKQMVRQVLSRNRRFVTTTYPDGITRYQYMTDLQTKNLRHEGIGAGMFAVAEVELTARYVMREGAITLKF